jgi:hypothetical protein
MWVFDVIIRRALEMHIKKNVNYHGLYAIIVVKTRKKGWWD